MVWIESMTMTAGLIFSGLGDDFLDAGRAQQLQASRRQAEALGAQADLLRRFLAGHVERAALLAELGQALQQDGRFADAGIAAQQDHRAFDQAATEHAVEFVDTAARNARVSAGRVPGPA